MKASWKSLLQHVFFIALFLLPSNAFFLAVPARSAWKSLPGEADVRLQSKIDFYKKNHRKIDLLFIGDSQTFQSIDPQTVDKYLGTTSFNLGVWTHWFPTQYAMIRDLLPYITDKTTVVWSIAPHSFSKSYPKGIYKIYPIGPSVIRDYFRFGFSFADVFDNYFYFNFFTKYCDYVPGLGLYARCPDLYRRLNAICQKQIGEVFPPARRFFPVVTKTRKVERKNTKAFLAVAHYFMRQPGVVSVDPFMSDTVVTMANVNKVQGNTVMVELEPEHFRENQKKFAARSRKQLKKGNDQFQCRREYWNLFVGILDLFEKKHVRLVVNEFEIAPIVYVNEAEHAKAAKILEKAKREVRRRNFPYLRVDYGDFTDKDYFDYNHLNIGGVRKYCVLLARGLRPYAGGMARR